MRFLPRRPAATLLVAAALVLALPSAPSAHEVPMGVTVTAFVKRDGAVLRLLVRVPLDAMRDIEFPLRGPGYLDVARSEPLLRQAAAQWVAGGIAVQQDGRSLSEGRVVAVRASLPSDPSFVVYASALANFDNEPLPDSADVMWNRALLDVHLEYPLASDSGVITLDPKWAHLGVKTTTVLRVIGDDGSDRIMTFEGNPGPIGLNPRWYHSAWRFMVLGFQHILSGVDHLLFLFALVIPVRRILPLIGIVTSFTVAHSITLVASAMGFAPDAVWFQPLIETLIALSIVYMAVENMFGAKEERRWMLAFGFGLVHGFGFSFLLRESLQFAGSHLVMALAAFNLGVEFGQLLVLAIAVPVLAVVFRRVAHKRAVAIGLSAVVAHQAWHWMTDRYAEFGAYEWSWPVFDGYFVAGLLRFLMLAIIAGGAMWLMSGLMGWLRRSRSASASGAASLLVYGVLLAGMSSRVDAQTSTTRSTTQGVFTEKQVTLGKTVYEENCLGCHTIASHTGAQFIGKWVGAPLADLVEYIYNSMPKSAPSSLTENEYVWVTAYLLRLNGMPVGTSELPGDPAQLKLIRIDTMPSGTSLSQLRDGAQDRDAGRYPGLMRMPQYVPRRDPVRDVKPVGPIRGRTKPPR